MLIIKAKLILAGKQSNEPEERKKSGIEAQAVRSRDWDKKMQMTHSTGVTRTRVRIMLSLAAEKIYQFSREI